MKWGKPDLSLEALRFLEEQPESFHDGIIRLRQMVLSAVPHAVELRIWGILSYYNAKRGGPVKGAICQIETRGGKLRLTFIQGIFIKDPRGLLQGDRVVKRYLPVNNPDQLPVEYVKDLIRCADSFCAFGEKNGKHKDAT